MIAYTDYPLLHLGDIAGKPAPVRKVKVVAYDGDKYAVCNLNNKSFSIKAGYLYNEDGSPVDIAKVPVDPNCYIGRNVIHI